MVEYVYEDNLWGDDSNIVSWVACSNIQMNQAMIPSDPKIIYGIDYGSANNVQINEKIDTLELGMILD